MNLKCCGFFFRCFSALRCFWGLGAVNKPILLCCLKLWNMMGLSVTTQQVFHGQTLNFAIKLQQKYAVSWKKMNILECVWFSNDLFHKYFVSRRCWVYIVYGWNICKKNSWSENKTMQKQAPCNWNNLVKCGMVHEYIKETQSNLFHWEKLSAAYPQKYLYISI